LPFAENDRVVPMWVRCGKGRFGASDYLVRDGTWMLLLPDDQLAIRWNDSSTIILSRAPAGTKPVASFDCRKAKTPVEKTICGSMELALFDRYVTSRIEILKDKAKFQHDTRFIDAAKDLEGVHQAWLVRRNKCGADATCLKRSLEELNDVMDSTKIPDFTFPSAQE